MESPRKEYVRKSLDKIGEEEQLILPNVRVASHEKQSYISVSNRKSTNENVEMISEAVDMQQNIDQLLFNM